MVLLDYFVFALLDNNDRGGFDVYFLHAHSLG